MGTHCAIEWDDDKLRRLAATRAPNGGKTCEETGSIILGEPSKAASVVGSKPGAETLHST